MKYHQIWAIVGNFSFLQFPPVITAYSPWDISIISLIEPSFDMALFQYLWRFAQIWAQNCVCYCFWTILGLQLKYCSLTLKSRKKNRWVKTLYLLRAAIYLVNSLVKKSDFGLIAAALKCAAMVIVQKQ